LTTTANRQTLVNAQSARVVSLGAVGTLGRHLPCRSQSFTPLFAAQTVIPALAIAAGAAALLGNCKFRIGATGQAVVTTLGITAGAAANFGYGKLGVGRGVAVIAALAITTGTATLLKQWLRLKRKYRCSYGSKQKTRSSN
jgi:hypothetical protein